MRGGALAFGAARPKRCRAGKALAAWRAEALPDQAASVTQAKAAGAPKITWAGNASFMMVPMELPIIIVEHHTLRQRGLLAYFAWLGLPALLWLGEGRPPAGRAALVCVADSRGAESAGRLDSRGLHALAVLRQTYPALPIVGYSLLGDDRLPGLRERLAAKAIPLIAPLGHLDELVAALREAIAAAC